MTECEPEADWTILDEITTDKRDGQDITVKDVIDRIARRLARDKRLGKVIDREDACQVGYTVAAMDATGARKALADGHFGTWVWDEIAKTDPSCGHADGGYTYDTLAGGIRTTPPLKQSGKGKRLRSVSLEALIDVCGDDMEQEMRLPVKEITQGGDRWATIYDVREAWRDTPLTDKQRRVLFMRCWLDETEERIGEIESISKQAAYKHIKLGVIHLQKSPHVAWLTNEDRYRDK